MSRPASVADVFRDHAARVVRFLRYMGVPEEALGDSSQEVFLVVHRRLAEFEGRATIETWLYEICMRVAQAERGKRRSAREVPTETLPEAEAAASSERQAARELLLRALDALDPVQREVFVLADVEEVPMKRVASIVDCPLFTAYSRRRLARASLRRELARLSEEGP
jgi:RNA polymerase sigma-70 factor (ECF subfamily)